MQRTARKHRLGIKEKRVSRPTPSLTSPPTHPDTASSISNLMKAAGAACGEKPRIQSKDCECNSIPPSRLLVSKQHQMWTVLCCAEPHLHSVRTAGGKKHNRLKGRSHKISKRPQGCPLQRSLNIHSLSSVWSVSQHCFWHFQIKKRSKTLFNLDQKTFLKRTWKENKESYNTEEISKGKWCGILKYCKKKGHFSLEFQCFMKSLVLTSKFALKVKA